MSSLEAAVSRLCSAFVALETEEECENFLRDLLSPGEFRGAVKRFFIAEQLDRGDSHREAIDAVMRIWDEASSATVSRVNRSLRGEESHDGYRVALLRLRNRRRAS